MNLESVQNMTPLGESLSIPTNPQTIISWDQIEYSTTILASKISKVFENNKDLHLVCVSRGGLFIGGLLSYALGLKHVHCVAVSSYKVENSNKQSSLECLTDFLPTADRSKTYLFVDDINDTSETYRFLKNQCAQRGLKMWFATTFHKARSTNLTPDFYGAELPADAWVVFPWDKFSQ